MVSKVVMTVSLLYLHRFHSTTTIRLILVEAVLDAEVVGVVVVTMRMMKVSCVYATMKNHVE